MVGSYPEIINNEIIPDESYVVIAGYSHEVDFEVLRSIFKAKWSPRYIGILASPKKGGVIISKLKEEFGENIDLGKIYSPIGLDIGGESPEEIAISIIAEIQSLRYDKNGNKHLSEKWSTLLQEK
ncbi:MAG: hypothetical protein CVV03_12580 [Firmicutes bacterium HGW-Firmicutes-8]|nr:MAG: hypothetical protein CVV03_12580 [Firmicutes bacterium HGW-Firmicutes-8]